MTKYFSIKTSQEQENINNENVINNPAPQEPQVANNPPIPPAQVQQPLNQPQVQQPLNANPVQQKADVRKVEFVEKKVWGALWEQAIVKLEGIKPAEVKNLQDAARRYIESIKGPNGYPPWAIWNNPKNKNKTEPAPFRLFSTAQGRNYPFFSIGIKDKGALDTISGHLKQMGFETSELDQFSVENPNQDPNLKPVEDNKVYVQTPSWDVISIRYRKDNDVTKFIKEERTGGRWNPENLSWTFSRATNSLPSHLSLVAEFMKKKGFDVSDFLKAINQYDKELDERKISKIDPNKVLLVSDESERTKFLMSITIPQTPNAAQELRDFVKFSFPSRANETDLKLPFYDDVKGKFVENPPDQPNIKHPPTGMFLEYRNKFYIHGKFDDFVRFGMLLKKSQWDTSKLRALMGSMVKNKVLNKTRYSGELDGYEIKNEDGKQLRNSENEFLYDYPKFYKDLENMVSGAKLFNEQKKGIAWLYSRESGILGDHTGTGKTLSTLVAAKARIKTSGGKVLILTLKTTQLQWVEEIKQKLGEDPANVSTDPSSNAQWIVISYSTISSKPEKTINGEYRFLPNGAPILNPKRKKAQECLSALFDNKFTVVIYDEAHVLKNENSGIGQNISFLEKRIPFKWGATATAAANTAQDVHNVLSLTGHSLEKMSPRDFNREFVGTKATTNSTTMENAFKAQEEAAYKLRKWLTLSGAYLCRSMKAINPNLPDHNIGEMYLSEEDIDMEMVNREIERVANSYKNQGKGKLSRLTATRVALSKMKVPHTMAEAKKLLDNGEKVLIFSCFRESCRAFVNELQQHLSLIDEDLRVVHIMDGDKNTDIQRAVAEFKDPESPVKAMVVAALKGGTGISMENSTQNVLMNDFDWTPRVCKQTEGRAFRINNVMPVNTRYVVVKGNKATPDGKKIWNPDELCYTFVRAKIKISNIIEELDAEALELISKGMDDTEVQKQILEAREFDRNLKNNFAKDFNEMMRQHGMQEELSADELDFDVLSEQEELLDDDDGINRQANTWYGLASQASTC
jgi:superfamily II DNA or RNA helicase